MYRLIDDLAARRAIYSTHLPTLPRMVLIDLPASFRGPGLLLARYYAAVAETDIEMDELERFLAAPRSGPVRPDLLDRRASAVRSDEIILARFAPPASDWPWLSLCRWPDDWAQGNAGRRADMARGCYTFEAFTHQSAIEGHELAVLASLRRNAGLEVRLIGADGLRPGGHA